MKSLHIHLTVWGFDTVDVKASPPSKLLVQRLKLCAALLSKNQINMSLTETITHLSATDTTAVTCVHAQRHSFSFKKLR